MYCEGLFFAVIGGDGTLANKKMIKPDSRQIARTIPSIKISLIPAMLKAVIPIPLANKVIPLIRPRLYTGIESA